MKKYLLLFPLAVVFFVTSSFVPASTTDVAITVNGGSFKINTDDIISTAWSLEKMQDAIGKADRDRDGYNVTHTYDKLNMVLFEAKDGENGSGRVSEVQIYFKVDEPNDVTPNGNSFTGQLMIDNVNITGKLKAHKMLKKLKNWQKTDSYMEHSYRMASNGLYIYFKYNNAETSLLKVSIGPDKR
jgi:hypothetical protein